MLSILTLTPTLSLKGEGQTSTAQDYLQKEQF
jgi:hypothetical protein